MTYPPPPPPSGQPLNYPPPPVSAPPGAYPPPPVSHYPPQPQRVAQGAPPPPQIVYVQAPGGPHQQVIRTQKGMSNKTHALLTFFTCGMWGIFVWLPIAIWVKFGPRKKTTITYR